MCIQEYFRCRITLKDFKSNRPFWSIARRMKGVLYCQIQGYYFETFTQQLFNYFRNTQDYN